MTVKLGVVMDPIADITYKKDTTLALLDAAQARGCELWYMEQADLSIQNGRAMARMAPLEVRMNPEDWFGLGEYQEVPLSTLDVVIMRKDPPFDSEFIYSTYILERAAEEGTLIANNPQSLRDCNEKVFATAFAEFMTPTTVTRRADLLKAFHQQHGDVIFKPLDGMGGSSIFRVRPDDPNVSVIIETLTNFGQQQIMAQRFIPQITEGDKRILMIDGEPVPYCLARIPAQGETRGNLAAGGAGITQPLSDENRAIAEKIGPVLKARGLYFVGLDIIGNNLTEINVTSPTCVREISRDSGIDVAGQLIDCLLSKL
ncbi:MAG: glutathione synthase [Oceanospirillaceae bacterium]|nr:glutathione synthase [Oceanospirillaceae bacterium]MBT11224.1 glutathione synthase [Oceanospirillaceae bacterium]|tara:strand:- start:69075 stop:70019 length:945 start_codon:yes stop_codon:yes gene_type:complete